jgi:predicted small integral membrane protein
MPLNVLHNSLIQNTYIHNVDYMGLSGPDMWLTIIMISNYFG